MATGNIDAAIAAADDLLAAAEGYGPALVELAKIYATGAERIQLGPDDNGSADSAMRARRIATAIRLLTSARDAGHFTDAANRTSLTQDPLWKVLRTNAEYTRLLAEIGEESK
jgi:hypothetical protein